MTYRMQSTKKVSAATISAPVRQRLKEMLEDGAMLDDKSLINTLGDIPPPSITTPWASPWIGRRSAGVSAETSCHTTRFAQLCVLAATRNRKSLLCLGLQFGTQSNQTVIPNSSSIINTPREHRRDRASIWLLPWASPWPDQKTLGWRVFDSKTSCATCTTRSVRSVVFLPRLLRMRHGKESLCCL